MTISKTENCKKLASKTKTARTKKCMHFVKIKYKKQQKSFHQNTE